MPENLLLIVVFLPLIGSLFVAASHNDADGTSRNATAVSIWVICCNILLILRLFSSLDIDLNSLQMISQMSWSVAPGGILSFGTDVLSLMIILSIHIALLMGIFGLKDVTGNQKGILFLNLLFLTTTTGFFMAADLFTFYMFFVLMIVPLFMEIGLCSGAGKKTASRFFLYNALGTLLLLMPVAAIYAMQNVVIYIENISDIRLPDNSGVFIWSGMFLAFILRLPVWPFHYWISSVNTVLKNPLVFTGVNLMPISGLYGFIRFWPAVLPEEIAALVPVFEILCVMTMLYLAFSGYSSAGLRDKLFSYIFIYYLLYLLGVFSPTDVLKQNIAYSLFAFLLVASGMIMIVFHVDKESEKLQNSANGILCLQPKAAFSYALLILAGVGFPVSALFWNNFIIVSEILNANVCIGTIAVFTMLLAAVFLLQNLYDLRDKSCLLQGQEKIYDIDNLRFAAGTIVMMVLFLSFIKPLWFVY